jgi:hypothetical protein
VAHPGKIPSIASSIPLQGLREAHKTPQASRNKKPSFLGFLFLALSQDADSCTTCTIFEGGPSKEIGRTSTLLTDRLFAFFAEHPAMDLSVIDE